MEAEKFVYLLHEGFGFEAFWDVEFDEIALQTMPESWYDFLIKSGGFYVETLDDLGKGIKYHELLSNSGSIRRGVRIGRNTELKKAYGSLCSLDGDTRKNIILKLKEIPF